jgi:hypothetical protein
MTGLADALSSASLLLAALALVYSAWSGSIDVEASRTYSANAETKMDEKKETRRIRNRRALPMAIGSWLIVAAFVPRDFYIFGTAIACVKSGSCGYDDVAAIFLLTQLLLLGFAVYLGSQVCALRAKLAE